MVLSVAVESIQYIQVRLLLNKGKVFKLTLNFFSITSATHFEVKPK